MNSSPEIPTEIHIKYASARYVDLQWSPSPSDTSAYKAYTTHTQQSSYFMPDSTSNLLSETNEKDILYQIVKIAPGNTFEKAFEGKNTSTRITNLAPESNYKFKLRVKYDKEGEDWSEAFIVAECKTCDENQILAAYEKLLAAIKRNNVQLAMEILAKHGDDININSTDKEGHTLAMIACRLASGDMVELLMKAGASVEAKTTSGKSLVSVAVSSGNLEAVQVLINHKADINVPDGGGSSPLMWAIQNAALPKELEIVKLLIKNGANVNAVDSHGLTAFDRLCRVRAEVTFAKALIEGGAKLVRTPTKHNPQTALMTAAQHGNSDLCVYLVEEQRFDPHIKNINGYSAADFAAAKGYHVLAEKLSGYKPIRKAK